MHPAGAAIAWSPSRHCARALWATPTAAGGHAKVVDFRIAKILEGTTYTMTGAMLGTCRYMSPEQVQSPTDVDHRADIYSLGVTLYRCLTGRCPFEGNNHFALMMAHVE